VKKVLAAKSPRELYDVFVRTKQGPEDARLSG
jgi:hypothetical protein